MVGLVEDDERPLVVSSNLNDELEDVADADGGGEISSSSAQVVLVRSKSGLQRCKTAPAMDMAAVLRDLKLIKQKEKEAPPVESETSSSMGLVRQAGLLLLIYLSMGVMVYSLNRDHFSGVETHPVVDALYFCIVTMCTIGYGDITPLTPSTKLFACLFVLVGFGFIDILLSGVVNHVLDLQERSIISDIIRSSCSSTFKLQFQTPQHQYQNHQNLLVDINKGRMRIRLKVGLALAAVVLCIGVGAIVLHSLEGLSWIDCFYLSALSVTTVGYGDRAFNTLPGRLFAAVWLLFSTLAVARAFLYLVEARIDKRQRTLAKWVLQRDITPQDLIAANINNNDFISKSEYVLFKLKEMGKIGEHDVAQICNQFKRLDPNNSGRITLTDLLQKHS